MSIKKTTITNTKAHVEIPTELEHKESEAMDEHIKKS
jgi:hypothetical protein